MVLPGGPISRIAVSGKQGGQCFRFAVFGHLPRRYEGTRVWNGLDQSAGFIIQSSPGGFGLDWIKNSPTQRILDWIWIQKCAMCIPYLETSCNFSLIVTLTSEVLPSNFRLYTSPFVFTCRFYNVFGRYLLCCVRIGLDWIQILNHQLDWTGLGSVTRGFGLDWIVSTQSIPYSGGYECIHEGKLLRACEKRKKRVITVI